MGAAEQVEGYVEDLNHRERHVDRERARELVVTDVEPLQPVELNKGCLDGTMEVVVGEVEPLEMVQLCERKSQLALQFLAVKVQPDDPATGVACDSQPCTAVRHFGGRV